jgi:hypothetical protein
MTGMHADTPNTFVGDYRAALRAYQHRVNLIEHLCDEATTGYVRVDLIRAALGERQ